MPVGQSIPVSAPIASLTGAICGEVGRSIAKSFTNNTLIIAAVTSISHSAGSLIAGWAVNAVLGVDVTGAAETTVQTAVTGLGHGLIAGSNYGLFEMFER